MTFPRCGHVLISGQRWEVTIICRRIDHLRINAVAIVINPVTSSSIGLLTIPETYLHRYPHATWTLPWLSTHHVTDTAGGVSFQLRSSDLSELGFVEKVCFEYSVAEIFEYSNNIFCFGRRVCRVSVCPASDLEN